MGEWVISDGQIGLSGDAERHPTGDEVFRSVLELEQVWEDVVPGRTGAASQIAFSRYPARPMLELKTSDGRPTVALVATLPAGGSAPLSKNALNSGHFIADGTWYPLEREASEEIEAQLQIAGVAEIGSIKSLRSILELKKGRKSGRVCDHLVLTPEIVASISSQSAERPQGVIASLYPYQTTGWKWLRFAVSEGVGALLGDEMGLGKTLQVISTISDPGKIPVLPVLIIAPGSLLENWCREFSKFAPVLKVLKHHGALRSGRPSIFDNYDVVVTSYDTVVRDGAMMSMREWGIAVIDEAQNIKNPSAQRTKSVKKIRRRAGLAVTGTPLENRLLDLWSIMDFVAPGYLGDETAFSNQYIDELPNAAELETLITPLMLRRLVKDVAQDLPPRIDVPQYLELDASETQQYEGLRSEILSSYGKAASLVALTKLRMFCSHPSLITNTISSRDFVKLERLDEISAEIFASNEKVLIFTSYTEVADLISARLSHQFSVFSRTLDGRVPIDDRQALIDKFAAVEGPAALVLNPKAGGAGLNITAANHVIHYNPEWNPALEDQASARSYRRGQTKPVTVHRFIIGGTVEEVIDERLNRKRDLSQAAVVGVAGDKGDFQDIVAALERSPLAMVSE